MELPVAFKNDFPLSKQKIYLNTAAWGLLSESLHFWRQEHDLDYLVGGSDARIAQLSLLEDTRSLLAEVFGLNALRVALVPNFSIGLNLILEGLPENSRILSLEADYPSVISPLKTRKFSTEFITRSAEVEDHIYAKLKQGKFDILVLSLVHWVDGMLIQPAFLSRLKEEFPELLIIADATQYLGAFHLHFDQNGIDILLGSGYKWLLGGNGNGFVFLSERAITMLDIPCTGFNSMGWEPLPHDQTPMARRLEPGHLDTLSFGSLHFSLQKLHTLGLPEIHEYNYRRSLFIRDRLAELNLLGQEISQRAFPSTIFSIPHSKALEAALKAAGVLFSVRGGGIRLSFHLYNDDNEVDALFEILKKAIS